MGIKINHAISFYTKKVLKADKLKASKEEFIDFSLFSDRFSG